MSEIAEICLICEKEKLSTEPNLVKVSSTSFESIKFFSKQWSEIGKRVHLHEIVSSSFSDEWKFHRNCYIAITHKNNLKAAQNAFKAKIKSDNKENNNNTACIICEKETPKPSKVCKSKVANDFLELKVTTANINLKSRLNSLEDPLEVRYHSKCLINEQKKTVKQTEQICDDKINYSKVNDDFIKHMKMELTSLRENSPTIDMKQMAEMYEHFLCAEKLPPPVKLLRPYIRSLLEADQKLMSEIDFFQNEPCKPTVVANKLFVSKLVCGEHFQDKEVDDNMLKTAKVIRKELCVMKPWEFNGAFDNFDNPPKLSGLIKFIISDDKTLDEKKGNEVDIVCSNITQYICSNFKSDRQLLYKSNKDRGFEKHRMTPLSVGTALVNYQQNKSKNEIKALSRIGLSINYDHVERILTGIASSAMNEASKNGLGIILPSCIKKGIRPVFAADNIDLGSDAESFHGADLMIVQRKDPERESVLPDFFFEATQKRSLKVSITAEIDENVELTTENNTKFKTTIQVKNSTECSKECQQLNMIWLFLTNSRFTMPAIHLYDEEDIVDEIETDGTSKKPEKENADKLLSWSTFHSSLAETPNTLSNVAIVAPLYRRSPTNVCVLMDILKRAQNITVLTIGPGKRTIITFDGDLWNRAVKIPNYKDNWIIRLGSLHVVIAALKCLGKYIEGSGIDTAWELSGMFGSATVNQVLEGRHIYRGIHVHTITLMALHYLYAEAIYTADEKRVVDNSISNLKSQITSGIDKASFLDAVQKTKDTFRTGKLFEKLKGEEQSGPTANFLCNYMTQILNLLTYIAATRNRNWKQHLATTEDVCKYFHAHDQSNYAKWALLYLADMLELETTDKDSWDFLNEGNFCVSKNEIPFTSIDPDHAIEHEHKPFKTRGGFVGITGNEAALERFVITMPILCNIAENFKQYSSIKTTDSKRQHHHEWFGNFFENQLVRSQNLINVLAKGGNPFLYPDLRHLVNYSVPSNEICKNIRERDVIGIKLVKSFREERMMENSTTPFWDTLSRQNLKIFSDTEIKVNNTQKLITTSIKKEKQLYARMLAISRTRPELCPDKVIGDYEFTNIPPSNFMPDGRMITSKPKANAKLISLIQKMQTSKPGLQQSIGRVSAIIINAWDLLNDIKKVESIKKVSDLVNFFLSELITTSNASAEIRLLFHPFVENSLNESSDHKNVTSRKASIYYHISKNTPVKNLDHFLAHVKTRVELATFLAKTALKHFQGSEVTFLVAYENKIAANRPLADICSKKLETGFHSLQGTNELILLNAVDISEKNSNRDLTIKASGTDIVIQLIDVYQSIPTNTTVNVSGQLLNIGDLHSTLGAKYCSALLGWYAFQGMDDCGAFRGKGVATQFKFFKKSDEDILCAFSNFGSTLQISETILIQMERFICLLYGNSSDKTIKDLRYLMSVKDGKDANQLPPTKATLIPHISRAYYQTLLAKNAIGQSIVPDPSNYHWTLSNEGKFEPVMCINSASPFELLELKSCGCKTKNKPCSRLSCKCLKNGLKCCNFCECGDLCENQPETDKAVYETAEVDDVQF